MRTTQVEPSTETSRPVSQPPAPMRSGLQTVQFEQAAGASIGVSDARVSLELPQESRLANPVASERKRTDETLTFMTVASFSAFDQSPSGSPGHGG